MASNSDVLEMQSFSSAISKMVSEHDRRACSETSLESNTNLPKHLNYWGLPITQPLVPENPFTNSGIRKLTGKQFRSLKKLSTYQMVKITINKKYKMGLNWGVTSASILSKTLQIYQKMKYSKILKHWRGCGQIWMDLWQKENPYLQVKLNNNYLEPNW